MASLSLPAPRTRSIPAAVPGGGSARTTTPITNVQVTATTTTTATAHQPIITVPSYEERCRVAIILSKLTPEQRKSHTTIKPFVPRSLADFDDGGAFPEIHLAQYPRHMGNPNLSRTKQNTTTATTITRGAQTNSSAIVNVEVDEKGDVSYDAIVKGGTNADKIVYSKYSDLRGGVADPELIALPTAAEEQETKRKTEAALAALLSKQTALDKPSGSAMVNAATSQNIEAKTQFIQYTPRPDAPGYNPAAAQRVIQMIPAQVDPMAPPKHKHVKAPRGPAEDPVPVLHAPPTKLTKSERAAWNIPACISNWKNPRGYTIPLDKRLAADGRGLRDSQSINPNFATLSESLYVAERQARQEVKLRAQVHKRLVLQEKEAREEELRQLANQARLERSSGLAGTTTNTSTTITTRTTTGRVAPTSHDNKDQDNAAISDEEYHNDHEQKESVGGIGDESRFDGREKRYGDDSDEQVAARQRERLRVERKRERERELRLENNQELKKQRFEQERDISEKIALGVHTGHGGGLAGEVDSRLYNQSSGMDSGFGADDEYNTYSKPLFDRSGVSSSSIYRPTRGETEYNADDTYQKLVDTGTSKFQPDKGFAGAEGGERGQASHGAGQRSAPVQFEKEK